VIFIVAFVLIGLVNGESSLAQVNTIDILHKDQINITQKERLNDGTGRDPFSLPLGVRPLFKGENRGETATVTKGEESKMGRVKAILISRHISLALVDRHIVKTGDSIDGEKVVEISPDQVILEKGGKKRTLFLYQSAIPLKVEEN
jgi:hypothetical protein